MPQNNTHDLAEINLRGRFDRGDRDNRGRRTCHEIPHYPHYPYNPHSPYNGAPAHIGIENDTRHKNRGDRGYGGDRAKQNRDNSKYYYPYCPQYPYKGR